MPKKAAADAAPSGVGAKRGRGAGAPAAAAAAAAAGAGKKAADAKPAAATSSSAAAHTSSAAAHAGLRERLGRPGASGLEVRLAARSGALADHTSGLAPGIAQANLVILPREHALDFLAFCTRNPKPCPLLEVTDAGVHAAPRMAPAGCDIRTDCPRYRVWRHGVLAEEVTDIRHLWPDAPDAAAGAGASSSSASASSSGEGSAATTGGAGAATATAAAPKPVPDARRDWVAFLLGCSFSFEEALLSAGLPVRHLQEEKEGSEGGAAPAGAGGAGAKKARKGGASSASSAVAGDDGDADADDPTAVAGGEPLASNPRNVPMYRTCIPCEPAGPFSGPLVVSMRPMTPEQAVAAAAVTDRFPRVHGRPVFAGDAAAIGIATIDKPDYGDGVTIRDGEVPVFWACGVTPQAALLQAKVPIAITHAPGHMLVLDKRNAELAGPAELDVTPFLRTPAAAAGAAAGGAGAASAGAKTKGKGAGKASASSAASAVINYVALPRADDGGSAGASAAADAGAGGLDKFRRGGR